MFIRYINWIWYILIKSCENVNRPVIVLTHVVWHYHQNDSRSILLYTWGRRVRLMVFNATFNNISAISWRSFLLEEETGVDGDKLHHIMLYRVHLFWAVFELTTLVVIGSWPRRARDSLISLAQKKFNLQLIETQGFWVQIRIWTCINNILKIYISMICGKWYFGVKCVFFFLVIIT